MKYSISLLINDYFNATCNNAKGYKSLKQSKIIKIK